MDDDTSEFAPMALETDNSPPPVPGTSRFNENLGDRLETGAHIVQEYPDNRETIPDLERNFTSTEAMRTVINRDSASPILSSERKRMMEYVSDNHEVLFTPAKTLNFTDADETETDIVDEHRGKHEPGVRNVPNGTDSVPILIGSGGQRIIEGHDSSPLDQNLVQYANPNVYRQEKTARKLSVESQEMPDISPNLYDSLDEKEDQMSQHNPHHKFPQDVGGSQTPPTLFSPVASTRSTSLQDQAFDAAPGSSFGQSAPLSSFSQPAHFSSQLSAQFNNMSHSLPETVTHDTVSNFPYHVAQKPESSAEASVAASEWMVPNVRAVNSMSSKVPVNHIALNIQRVKNASKANKPEASVPQEGSVCPRVGRIEQKQNVSKSQQQLKGRASMPSKSVAQSRPMVQGSSGHDHRQVTSHPRPVAQNQASQSGTSNTQERYGGVGSEIMGNPRPAADHQNSPRNMPGYVQQNSYSPAAIVSSPRVMDPELLATQVGQMNLAANKGYNFSPQEGHQKPYPLVQDIQGMEDVRSHLQSMLKLSTDAVQDSGKFDQSGTASELLLEQPLNRHLKFDTSSVLGSRVQEEVSDLFESFPNFSSKIFSDLSSAGVGRQEAAVQNENQYLREMMEKERYRRKHCEQHIQHLNSKLLETQQQLAVAVSTDKKKDIMIEQLDKQLAKVVEGWKKREREKDDYMKMLMKEKSQIEQTLNTQQSMINTYEREMSQTVNELRREKENWNQAFEDKEREVEKATRDKYKAEEVLEAERERMNLVTQEWEQLKEARELAEHRAQQLQERLHKEQDEGYKREQELLAKIDDVKEANLKVIQMERLKTEEKERRVTELEDRSHSLETENKRLDLELDEAKREKESLKVEMAIHEAKFESSQRKLEADLHSQMEKEISAQVSEVHQKIEELQEELQEKHRRQVSEIHGRHQKDLNRQIQNFQDDARRTEDNHRQLMQDLEERLAEYRNENASLKHAKQKLESQRMEILTKIQYMMQSQWNEAVSLLVATPQRKQAFNGSFISSISQATQQQPQTSQAANLNISVVSSGQPKTSSPNREEDSGRPPTEARHQQRQRENLTPPDVGRVEDYINSLPTASQSSPAHQDNHGFQAPHSTAAHNQSFSSESSGGHVMDSVGSIFPGDAGRVVHFPQLNLDQSHLPQLAGLSVPQNIHGYVVSQSSSVPPSQTTHVQALTNQNQALFNLMTQPAPAVMLRPPQQQSHVYAMGQGRGQVMIAPSSPSKSKNHRRVQQMKDSRTFSHSDDSDDDTRISRPRYVQPGMSPPVKQSRRSQEAEGYVLGSNVVEVHAGPALDDTLEETVRLNADYSHISDRVAEHETRHNELQHYIKMLLDKPPTSSSDVPEQDLPLGSDILETSREMTGELDLNDTAQAAELNRELHRLQQLREQVSQRDALLRALIPEKDIGYSQTQNNSQDQSILQPDQLAEISQLLEQYRQQGETATPKNDTVNQLLYMIQNLTPSAISQKDPPSNKASPRGSQRSKSRVAPQTGQKKSHTGRPPSGGNGKQVLDTSQAKSDSSQSGRPQKKVERKVAGSKTSQPKTKSTAWK